MRFLRNTLSLRWAPELRARLALAMALALALAFGLFASTASAAEPEPPLPKVQLRILFANSLIQNVNRTDVMVAFKLWIETVGRSRGYSLVADPDSYDRLDEVEKRLREDTLDLVIFSTMDYLEFAEGGPLEPIFTPIRTPDDLTEDYVLVTRRGRNLESLAALRGKSVVFHQHGANLGRRWMEVTLGESGLGSVNEFFGTRGDFTKPSSVVLPVFFGKFDAGVVQRSTLDTMKELNPQLGTQLQVVTHSAHLSESVICLHRNYADDREDLISGLAELHTEPRGQQVLLVFKIRKLIPFKPEYLDHVRDLKTRQGKLETPSETNAVVTTAGGGSQP